MKAEEFFNSMSITDANHFVVDRYQTKFSKDELLIFAEAFCDAEVEQRIAERVALFPTGLCPYPGPKDARQLGVNAGFLQGWSALRSRLTNNSQKTEGGIK